MSSEVGYKKPPVEHRIKPGERRNPFGRAGKRPKVAADNSVRAIIERLDNEPVEINGRKMTKRELELRVIQAKALKGDTRASQLLDGLRRNAGVGKPKPSGGVLLIPASVPLDEWEAAASRQQAQFRGPAYGLEDLVPAPVEGED